MIPAAGVLTREGAEALNTKANLTLYWSEHGLPYVCDPVNYDKVQGVVDTLSPARGDILVVEGVGFDNEATPDHIAWKLMVDARQHGLPTPDSQTTPQLIEQLRDNNFITAYPYAMYKALLKGLHVAYADINETEEQAWHRYMRARGDVSPGRFFGYAGKLAAANIIAARSRKEYHTYRDTHTVRRLGDIALTLPAARQRPTMAVLRGSYHRKAVEDMLSAADVAFTSYDISPKADDPSRAAWLARFRRQRNATRTARRALKQINQSHQ